MEAIRKCYKIYGALFIISVFSTVWFLGRLVIETVIVFGCANIVLLILLIKQKKSC